MTTSNDDYFYDLSLRSAERQPIHAVVVNIIIIIIIITGEGPEAANGSINLSNLTYSHISFHI